MERSGSGNSAKPGTSGLSVALGIDLNETPLPSPREIDGGGGGGYAPERRCGSCGEVEREMVECGDCRKWFHVSCSGVREGQRDWTCLECGLRRRLIGDAGSGGVGGSGGRGLGLLDINASPPREPDGDEEGFFVNSPQLRLMPIFPKTQDMQSNPFGRLSSSSPMTPLDMTFIPIGFASQKANSSRLQMAHMNLEIAYEDIKHCYLKELKEYVSARKGVLGDGWRIGFKFTENYKTVPIFFSPDGQRLNSMEEVGQHLGLTSVERVDIDGGILSFPKGVEKDDIDGGLLLFQKGLDSKRTKEASKSRANNRKHMFRSRVNNAGNAVETDNVANGTNESQSFTDNFPVQFEDLFVMSVGKIDPRLTFHNVSQIWPVGYISIWHDKFTGSIFVCKVLDGGDCGPKFRVHRYPCTKKPIPNASVVLCRSNSWPAYDDSDAYLQMMLTEQSQPQLPNCLNLTFPLTRAQRITSDNFGRGDVIGEFSVEGRTSSSVWLEAVETLLQSCHKAYDHIKVLNFCCNHNVNEQYYDSSHKFDPLRKFCYLAGPVNSIPDLIMSVDELEVSCKFLRNWLQMDRFGLDLEFVQELMEQLPGVNSCSEYKSLTSRSQSSSLQTVKSGFFMAISTKDLGHEKILNDLRKSQKRPRPPGRTVTSNLPPHLIGDVIQVYEMCSRFYEVLGQEAPPSKQELEYELKNPWVDDLKPAKRSLNEVNDVLTLVKQDSATEEHEGEASRAEKASKCTGVKLAKFHMAFLKPLVEEMLSKVAEVFDPFRGVESKSKKGRKKEKDVDFSIVGKKIKLDMFPVNEFTWPEVARRYILVVLAMEGKTESSEIMARECGKVFHCLNGDGGSLCGSLKRVPAMEADAMVLAEASKKIFSSVKSTIVDFIIDPKDIDTGESANETNVTVNESPEWIRVLEPVRKLPTNVGARIRRCINEALEKNPPEWARNILEHSISKDVYKGNASGPTKRAVISVLEKMKLENPLENPQQKPIEKKEKEKSSTTTLSEVVMKRCRMVLRSVANKENVKVFCNLFAKLLLKPNDIDDVGLLLYPAMVSRPMDFRTVDFRLAAGVYGSSHESFFEDVCEIWQHLRIAYRDRPEYLQLVTKLAKKFEELYDIEVLNLVNRIMEIGSNLDSSNDEAKKELNSILVRASEISLPSAPWERVCKVCGMDKDDDSVLLCDTCDSEYHTYCLDPPLFMIPEGDWYCPSCESRAFLSKDDRCGTRVLCRRREKKRLQKDFSQKLLEGLAPIADSMELTEYWELGIEERVFLFKFLCDEVLSCGVLRNHLGPDSADLEKKLRKLYKELKEQQKREEFITSALTKQREDGSIEPEGNSIPSSLEGSSQSQSQSQPPENQESEDQNAVDYMFEEVEVKKKIESLKEKIASLELQIIKLVVRREYLGMDAIGRFYWVFSNPERVVVSDPRGGNPFAFAFDFDFDLWTSYESDLEIKELVRWLRDDIPIEKELKENIAQWQRNKVNDPRDDGQTVKANPSKSLIHCTKARSELKKKFGSFSKHGAIRKDKTVKRGKWYRCDCLEIVASTRHHCCSCHKTFMSNEELEEHDDGNCEKRDEGKITKTSLDGMGKGKGKCEQPALTVHQSQLNSPFDFEEIMSKFFTRTSIKEEVKDIGLLGSNGTPVFMAEAPRNINSDSFLLDSEPKKGVDGSESSKQGPTETPSKVDRSKVKGTSKASKSTSPVRICQSSLKPLSGRVLEILRCLKITLFDIETALPEEAFRASRGGVDKLCSWRAFVKSAQSIYEMVQATIVLEDMIKTEYLRKEWWYWSSPSTAAKISTISALALRIYSLDSVLHYEKPPNVDIIEPETPADSKSEKETPSKSKLRNHPKSEKGTSEKSNSKNTTKSTTSSTVMAIDTEPAESSRSKSRVKKRRKS